MRAFIKIAHLACALALFSAAAVAQNQQRPPRQSDEGVHNAIPASPSHATRTKIQSYGWEKGFNSEANTQDSEYKNAADEKIRHHLDFEERQYYADEMTDVFMEGVKAGRLDKAEVQGYKSGYTAFTNLKKTNSKSKVNKKVSTAALAKDAGYTDSAETGRFKQGAEKAQKDVSAGKKSTPPSFSNPYN